MIAAPRCCTVGMNSSRYQACGTRVSAGAPATVACARSGNCVAEWLPQIVTPRISVTGTCAFAASCARARLWSSRVIAVKLRASRPLAFSRAISAFVFAGLPTTRIFTLRLATAASALPCAEKICAFASKRSLRSMPGPRGRAPTSRP